MGINRSEFKDRITTTSLYYSVQGIRGTTYHTHYILLSHTTMDLSAFLDQDSPSPFNLSFLSLSEIATDQGSPNTGSANFLVSSHSIL